MRDLSISLQGKQTNYMAPFIGISGTDSYETVLEKFRDFRDMGIYSATLQYSSGVPNNNSIGLSPFDDRYFNTLRYMSRACRELGMTYWVQDAAPFPTGAANGRFLEAPWDELAKVYLEERHTLVQGPLTDAVLLAENYATLSRGDSLYVGGGSLRPNKLLYIVAMPVDAPTDEYPTFDGSRAIDLTAGYDPTDGTLLFSLPEGYWRVFFLYETRTGGRKGFMNLLDADSVRVNLEAVHELHYQQMKEELGKTWMGFFYDEPEIGNEMHYNFNSLPAAHPGKTPVSLPWSRSMPQLMSERLGENWALHLPELWYDCGAHSRITRFHFMDLVTGLVEENYNGIMLPWCRERGIGYHGHVLEDENSHARLGCGPGHYFRFQKHQDMAGIDLVGGQLMPGMDVKGSCWYSSTDGDGELYHYGIAKLAASEAAINPDKRGRSFCEINAVYSSVSNPKLYKYLLDHLMVSGINHLIPVFTNVVNTPEGKLLFDYANRVCGLLDGSQPMVPVAVLYHAESEWSGAAQMFHRAGKELIRHQLDFHVLPSDALTHSADYRTALSDKHLIVNGNAYRAIVIPRCDYLRADVLAVLREAAAKGVAVYFVDALPIGCCEHLKPIDWSGFQPVVVPLGELGETLSRHADLFCSPAAAELRYRWFRKDGLDWFWFVNTAYRSSISTTVTLPVCGDITRYDPMLNRQEAVCCSQEGGKLSIELRLDQWEGVLFAVDSTTAPAAPVEAAIRCAADCGSWQLSFADSHEDMTLSALCDLGAKPGLRRYVQPITYRSTLNLTGPLPAQLDLGQVCDSARLIVNGIDLGLRIAEPYVFDLDGALQPGKNTIEVIILPAAARRRGAPSSDPMAALFDAVGATTYAVMQPVGLLGPVELIIK